MKKVCLILVLTLSLGSFSQEKNPKENELNSFNEFKLNIGYLLFEFADFSYERILNEESSVGISFGFSLDDAIDYKFGVIPFYRFYFGKKPAAGFFIEGNGALFSEESITGNNEIGLGFGIAIGGKFLTKKNWIGEIVIGGGRSFVNKDIISEGYPRIGISIGKRF